MLLGANAKSLNELCQLKYEIIYKIIIVRSEFMWDINHRLSDKYLVD